MRFLLIISCFFLMGLTPIQNEHKDQIQTDEEFVNLYNGVQAKNFKVFNSTPNVRELEENEVVVVGSGTFVNLMFRFSDDIFAIKFSCVTAR